MSIDVWVDATSDAVRVASRGPTHKLTAALEVWRNTTSGYPSGVVNGSVVYHPPLGCPALHPNITLHPDIIVQQEESILFYHRNLEEWCENRFFGAIFILKTIILPRQARGKHRKNLRKRRFLQGGAVLED
eukprot:COSAG06_NODE_820_length_12102_cov_16.846205_21_plen_131_part_00